MKFSVRAAIAQDAPWMQDGFAQMGWRKPDGYFAGCCRLQNEGKLVLLVADMDGQYLGHLKIIWAPDYPFFRDNGIPEIQDLNVIPSHRRQGIATKLMDVAEDMIRQRSKRVGIGVGLHPGYNAAQRMYVLRGYVPDGQGVSYQNRYIQEGQHLIADDDLILHLIKELD